LRRQKRRRQLLVTVSCARGPTLNALPGGTLLLMLPDLVGTSAGIADETQTLFGLTHPEAHATAARLLAGLRR
jgi:hypothetical protein